MAKEHSPSYKHMYYYLNYYVIYLPSAANCQHQSVLRILIFPTLPVYQIF